VSLQFRQLQLRAVTAKGVYGATLAFEKGLVVVRAGNSSGKSTCVQSIIYALGLEGMISKKHSVPLPHCMTERLEDRGTEIIVLESSVLLEIENQKGEVLSIQRPVKSTSRDTHLVSTWDGPALTSPSNTYLQRDYFVRYEGAAQRERGFHHRLASFLGWELPDVPHYDESTGPLYLECIFPLAMIEQKHGWSGIQASIPVHYGIREVGKRSTEFLLALDAYKNSIARQELNDVKENIKRDWQVIFNGCQNLARAAGGVLQGLAAEPTTDWPRGVSPQIVFFGGVKWLSLTEELAEKEEQLKNEQSEEIQLAGEAANQVKIALEKAYEALRTTELLANRLMQELGAERAQVDSIDQRLEALKEDLYRHKDVQRLQRLGSEEALEISKDICPTCHQAVTDSLLPQDKRQTIMSVEENLDFIEGQLRTFESMRADAERVQEAKRQQVNAFVSRADELRTEIRAHKTTLTSSSRLPSISALRQRMVVEDRITKLRSVEEDFRRALEQFRQASELWRITLEKIRALPSDDLSQNDKQKLSQLQDIVVDQLHKYEFSSVSPRSISISSETYKPIHEDGFDLGFDLSATDMIRLIWSYLVGLLELTRSRQTDHPGFLIFDEPRQHEMSPTSYAEFLRRVANSRDHNQQVIVTSSGQETSIKEILGNVPFQLIGFPGKILTRLA